MKKSIRYLIIIVINCAFNPIVFAQGLGIMKGDFLEIGRIAGTTPPPNPNVVKNLFWLLRDADGRDWYTARFHDGISIDASFLTPAVSTKTWWERDPHHDIQSWGNASATYLTINAGNVGIGTATPQAKLAVNGNILAKEVKVKTDISVPDYVFAPEYELPALADVEAYVKEHRHLPEIPSAKDIERDGLDLAEMNLLLLKKVEELTLYIVGLKKGNEEHAAEIDRLKTTVNQLLQQ
ncbi:hypothetical protein JHJ32_21550 [Parapedobacter sp. ISTM3]|uniref:hypothetical protein n=1 Tax=Parapedobacter sp. ISTM3 TaxID=2800130 RepID=UPI00190569B4|nr:hypothetical protein [Parapedobacter sp. ISTM3]MBK1442600.1 hypothetical protein [Parapedobacter sp. ISTM3]